MKVYKGKGNYSDSLYCVDTDSKGNKNKCYISIGYKQGVTVSDTDYNAEFVMKTSDGVEHECYFSCYKKKDGTVEPKLIVLS